MVRPIVRTDAAGSSGVASAIRLASAVAASACVAISLGCETSGTGLRGAQAGEDASILDLFTSTDTPTNAIEDALNEFDADRRRSGLARIAAQPWGGEPTYVDFYRLALQDADAAVRGVAAQALALHGEAEDAVSIAGLLTDDDRLVRWTTARALQRLHNPAVVDALIPRTLVENEPDALVRGAASRALGQYAEPRVLQALIRALDDPDLAVNAGARDSLGVLTGAQLGYAPEAWTAWVRDTEDPFAGRQEYIFPAFERDARWFEVVNPFYDVPNEPSTRPVGMPTAGTGL